MKTSQVGTSIGKSGLLKSISIGSYDVVPSDTVTCKVLHDAVCDGKKIAEEIYARSVREKGAFGLTFAIMIYQQSIRQFDWR